MSETQTMTNLPQEVEQALVREAAAGGQEALARLLVQYAPLLRAESRRNRLAYLAEEVQSMAQLYFMEAVKRYEPERGVPFAAFAQRVVHGGVSTFTAAEQRRRERELNPDDYASASETGEGGSVWDAIYEAAEGVGGMDAYARVDLRETVRLAMAQMSHNEREVLVCVYVQQRTLQETAERMGVAVLTVKRCKQRLLAKLRQALA